MLTDRSCEQEVGPCVQEGVCLVGGVGRAALQIFFPHIVVEKLSGAVWLWEQRTVFTCTLCGRPVAVPSSAAFLACKYRLEVVHQKETRKKQNGPSPKCFASALLMTENISGIKATQLRLQR